MAQSYTTVTKFKKWIPQKHLGELSNDIDGSFSIDSEVLQEALEWGASILESKISVRDDMPIPVVNGDGSVPNVVIKFVHTLAMFWLYERRGTIPDQMQTSFDVQMAWIERVRDRKANILLTGQDGEEVTETTETPEFDGNQKRSFDDFSFG